MRQWQRIAVVAALALSSASWLAAADGPEAGRQEAVAKVGDTQVSVNAKTGRLVPLSQQEVQKVARSLRQMLRRQAAVNAAEAEGAISADLQGGFQNVWLARLDAQGEVQHACVDSMSGALAFLNSTGGLEDM
jgi:hypothetical protein